MRMLMYLIAIAVVVGGAVLLFGGRQAAETPADLAEKSVREEVLPAGATSPEKEAEAPFPPASLYNAHGFLDCGYFWNDVRAACPEVKQTKWNTSAPWDINAFPDTCKMLALGSKEGEFLVNVSRSKSAASADALFDQVRGDFAKIGYKTLDVAGLGEKAYTVPDPFAEVQSGYNFNVKKGVWLVDMTSSNPAFCITAERTRDVVQRMLRKLP